MNKSLLTQYFLRAGKIEGYSFLLLLMVAMPLKYIWEQPEWVRIVGMIHGVLFLIFIVLIYLMVNEKLLNIKKAIFAFLLSIIPFGTFFLKKLL
jgi:integral membrane protein